MRLAQPQDRGGSGATGAIAVAIVRRGLRFEQQQQRPA